MPSFIEKLEGAIERNHSLLCIGLDPEATKFQQPNPDKETLLRWSLNIIEQTADVVCCYKPNIAFYEQFGLEGLAALRDMKAKSALRQRIMVERPVVSRVSRPR